MKCILTAILFMLLAGSALADTDMLFEGTLVSEPCSVDVKSAEQTIDFRVIAAKTFLTNKRSAPIAFSIKLVDCDLSVGTRVSTTFIGTEDSTQTGTFAVTGGAQGVAIALETDDGDAILPNQTTSPEKLSDDETVLNYKAYVQGNDASAVKEGEFTSVVTFSLTYQ